jgi:hypothetical protein
MFCVDLLFVICVEDMLLVQFCPAGFLYSCPPDQVLGPLIKELASRLLISAGFFYRAPSST